MLKLYKAYTEYGNLKVEDSIDFYYGRFDSGLNGYGHIQSGNTFLKSANFELESVQCFKEYIKSVKLVDGFVTNFVLLNPIDYETLNNKYGDVQKDFETYESLGFNEEAIILFTDNVKVSYPQNGLIEKIFGRFPETAMYLLMPNATLDMYSQLLNGENSEHFEVLQSKRLGKQLALTKQGRNL